MKLLSILEVHFHLYIVAGNQLEYKRPSIKTKSSNKVLRFWQTLSTLGVNDELTFRIQKKVVLSNQIAIVILAIQLFSYVFLFGEVFEKDFNISASRILISFFLLGILLLNKYGFTFFSRSFFSIIFPFLIFTTILLSLITHDVIRVENIIGGRIVNTCLLLLVFVLLDSKNERGIFTIALVVNLLIIFFFDTICEYLGIINSLVGGKYDSNVINSVVVLISIFIILVMLHIEGVTNSYEKKNVELINNLKSKNSAIYEQSQEIQAQMEEIRSQSDLMMAQNDQLIDRENMLLEKERTISDKNRELSLLNEGLELKVKERTDELNTSNLMLKNRLDDLNQFAYTLSHTLRAPAASIKGLVNLWKYDPTTIKDFKIPKMISHSTDLLLQVMSELQYILDIKKSDSVNLKLVKIDDMIDSIFTNQFGKVLQSEDFKLSTDFKIKTLWSEPVYLKNIITNLIDNAIKFRNPDRLLTIHIETIETPSQIQIVVTDNGLGFDSEHFKNDLFKLYKRFHTSTTGSGVGLYIAKSQVEILHGNVKIESNIDKGTVVRVDLPKHSES